MINKTLNQHKQKEETYLYLSIERNIFFFTIIIIIIMRVGSWGLTNLQFGEFWIMLKLALPRGQSFAIHIQHMHTPNLLQRSHQPFVWLPLHHLIF